MSARTRPTTSPSIPLLVSMVVVLVTACGGEAGPSPAAFAEGFERAAQAAYDAAGADRGESPLQGASVDGCPLVDDAALAVLAEAAGVEALEVAARTFVSGLPEDEVMACSLATPDGEQRLGLNAGRTRSTAAQLADQQARDLADRELDASPLALQPDGLEADDVVAFSRGGDELTQAAWVREDVLVSVGGPLVDDANAGDVLAVAVAEVARVLTAG